MKTASAKASFNISNVFRRTPNSQSKLLCHGSSKLTFLLTYNWKKLWKKTLGNTISKTNELTADFVSFGDLKEFYMITLHITIKRTLCFNELHFYASEFLAILVVGLYGWQCQRLKYLSHYGPIAITFCTDVHGLQRIIPVDFGDHLTLNFLNFLNK